MNDTSIHQRMQAAWAIRREALGAESVEQRAGFERARQMLVEVVRDCRERKPQVDYAQALHLLANLEVDLGDDSSARSLWEDAVGILRELDEPLQLAHKLRHLGDLHHRQGSLDQAEAFFTEALDLYRTHGDTAPLDWANALRRMALLMEQRSLSKEALAYWHAARKRYQAVDLIAGIEEADTSIARLRAGL